jgi:hypothetical protein
MDIFEPTFNRPTQESNFKSTAGSINETIAAPIFIPAKTCTKCESLLSLLRDAEPFLRHSVDCPIFIDPREDVVFCNCGLVAIFSRISSVSKAKEPRQ